MVRHFGRGDLVIGALNASSGDESVAATLQDLVGLFATADVNVTISSDVMAELWSKLMVNCAYKARGKPSEIDHLNRFVSRRGRELGVATPVNQTLHALVKLVEAGNGGR
jgi:ketopantoate reductase